MRRFKLEIEGLKVLHERLTDDYIRTFGWGSQEEVIKKKMEIGRRLYKKVVLGDKDQDTLIDLAKAAIASMKAEASQQETNFYLSKAIIEKELGIPIDASKVSIKQYHAYMQLFEKIMNQRKKSNK